MKLAARTLLVGIVISLSCADVVPGSRTTAPLNTCPDHPCDGYGPAAVKPECVSSRCEIQSSRDFVLQVSVPSGSYFGSGRTFWVTSAFVDAAEDRPTCTKSTCIALPPLARIAGEIIVPNSLRARYGLSTTDSTIPARVEFTPILAPEMPTAPLETTVASVTRVGNRARYEALLPAGKYARRIYPLAPYESLPPIFTELTLFGAGEPGVSPIEIGSTEFQLDSVDVSRRTVHIERAAGLAGFRVWLEDAVTKRRVSGLATILSGTQADVLVDTLGQNENGALRPGINVVAEPPVGAASPRLESAIVNEAGFNLSFPDVPPAVTVVGTVRAPGMTTARLANAIVTFTSLKLERLNPDVSTTLLTFKSRVTTDDAGEWFTTLPRGEYQVDVDPGPLSDYAPGRATVEVVSNTSFELQAVEGVSVGGLLQTADGRVFPDTEVTFLPVVSDVSASTTMATSSAAVLHPRRFTSDSFGQFSGIVGVGRYDVTFVIPPWTGFSRVVLPARDIRQAGEAQLDAKVAVPSKIAYSLHDGLDAKNVVPFTIVRAFVLPRGTTRYVEAGVAMTSATGDFEILVAP